MAEIGLAAAAYAEIGLRALEEGDLPRAVGALSSISDESWQALAERFPGFPTQLAEEWPQDALSSPAVAAIENADR